MPESKGRGVPKSRPPQTVAKKDQPLTSPRWLAPTMVALFVIGLLWIVVHYLAPDLPVFSALGNWNIVIGFGLIMGGFALSTRWR